MESNTTDNEKKVWEGKAFWNASEPRPCPHCGFEYSHIHGVRTSLKDDDAKSVGIEWDARSYAVVQLDMKCESGHDWKLILAEYKGHLYITSH